MLFWGYGVSLVIINIQQMWLHYQTCVALFNIAVGYRGTELG